MAKLNNTEELVVQNLKRYFKTNQGTVKAVDGVSFSIRTGETLGLVGESGSGKSTTGYVVVGIYRPTDGKVFFKGTDISFETAKRQKSTVKGIQIVFQDPGSSLNPKKNIKQILELPLQVFHIVEKGNYKKKTEELLRMVELPTEYLDRSPSDLGGGEKQLVAIARAIAPNPSCVVLDEPTSALDVSVQAKVIGMLQKLQKELGLSYLFITHDLSLLRNVADRLAIMYLGRIQEVAPTESFFRDPLHPYTRMLLSCIPVISEEEKALRPKGVSSEGEIPSPVDIPPGCRYYSRCPERMEKCLNKEPEIVEFSEGRSVRCYLIDAK